MRAHAPSRCAAIALCAILLLLAASGCKSYWVEATIQNRSGQAIHELEVDYPSASFGTNLLADGAEMHYRFQIRGQGQAKLEYTAENGKTIRAQGPALAEHQRGLLLMRLLPGGKVEFVPKLEPAS